MLSKKQKGGKVVKGSKHVGDTHLTTVTTARTEKGASEPSMEETILIEDSVEQSGMTKDGQTIPIVNSKESSAVKQNQGKGVKGTRDGTPATAKKSWTTSSGFA